MVPFLKWVLVLASLFCGALFLSRGLGVEIPLVKYKGVEAHDVPAGVAFLVAGVALARFWKIKTITIVRETETKTSRDGHSTKSQKTTTTVTEMRGPEAKGPGNWA